VRSQALREGQLLLFSRLHEEVQRGEVERSMTREETAEWIGKQLDDAFNLASQHGFGLETCCSKHILIVDRSTDDVMYEVDTQWQ
jgi:hypothetical protein